MTDIVWSNVTVTLGQLQPWERNPKSISKAHAKRLLASWDKFGQFQTVAIGPGCEVYDGHQRLSVLLAAYGPGYQIDARQSEVALTDAERQELVIAAHVGTTGQFNWDELANWDAAELQEWGLDGEQLQDWKTSIGAVINLLGSSEILDYTSTERENQGVSSTWDSVKNSDNQKVIIGNIETRIDGQLSERLSGYLKSKYENDGTPINIAFEEVLITGLEALE